MLKVADNFPTSCYDICNTALTQHSLVDHYLKIVGHALYAFQVAVFHCFCHIACIVTDYYMNFRSVKRQVSNMLANALKMAATVWDPLDSCE